MWQSRIDLIKENLENGEPMGRITYSAERIGWCSMIDLLD